MKKFITILLPLLIFATVTIAQITLVPFAGTGWDGFSGDGGPATAAMLNLPTGIALDGSNCYIADSGNHRIRKVDAAGIITTIAGNGIAGFSGDGGMATDAQLNCPIEITADRYGNVFIADKMNSRIRKIDPTGVITTVAGGGTSILNNVPALSAFLNEPNDISVNASGDIFIADTKNRTVRKVSAATGLITTVAGTGTAGLPTEGYYAVDANLWGPVSVKAAHTGVLYIADNNRIWEVDTSGRIFKLSGTHLIGFSGDGTYSGGARLDGPIGLEMDVEGNLLFADMFNERIRRITTASWDIITTAIGGGSQFVDGELVNLGELCIPADVGVTGTLSSMDVYVADMCYHRIFRVTTPVSTAAVYRRETEMKVTPNPSNGHFTVLISSMTNEVATVEIFDVIGKKLLITITRTNEPLEISLNIPSGTYFVKASTEYRNCWRKIVVDDM